MSIIYQFHGFDDLPEQYRKYTLPLWRLWTMLEINQSLKERIKEIDKMLT